jgi:hypothetical protein
MDRVVSGTTMNVGLGKMDVGRGKIIRGGQQARSLLGNNLYDKILFTTSQILKSPVIIK